MTGAAVVGILLAAGSASRFGADKLLVRLSGELTVGAAALANLASALDSVVAVVRTKDAPLADAFARAGARTTICPWSEEGMGASLAWGVRASPVAAGWVVALADMPWIATATIVCVREALRRGALLAAPTHGGVRGHPVGISARYYGELCGLSGDEGAKRVLAAHATELELIETDDPGVLRDIDAPGDLER